MVTEGLPQCVVACAAKKAVHELQICSAERPVVAQSDGHRNVCQFVQDQRLGPGRSWQSDEAQISRGASSSATIKNPHFADNRNAI
jgi:hypothetical protein